VECQMVELRREELYEKVWSTPMQKLAREFGLSDVGLAKLCRRYQIPVPGRGYWRRPETGQTLARSPLPEIKETGSRMEIIKIFSREHERRDENTDMAAFPDAPSQETLNILISEDRPISHPFARRAKRLLSKERKDERGILIPEYGSTTPLSFSAKALPRALRILDALLFALEQCNISVQWPDGKEELLGVVVLDHKDEILNLRGRPAKGNMRQLDY